MGDARTDEALMLAYRDGEAGAFDVLYGRHRAPVYRYLLRQCAGRAQADEVFQEVWMAVIRARAGYEVVAKFTTWLYRIAHNKLVDHYRLSGRIGEYEAPMSEVESGEAIALPDAAAETPEQVRLRQEVVVRLVEAVDALPLAQREAFLLAADGELSVEEIARATGVPFETAKSRLRYANARLRQLLVDLRR
ncbi:MAG TPA: RNA polymerase sigma factor [Rhodocyclaceae bacterium]